MNRARSALYSSNNSINSDATTAPSVTVGPEITPRLTSTTSVPGHKHRLSGSMGRLHRKWRSASDFDSQPSPGLSVYKSGCHLREVNRAPKYFSEEGILRLHLRGKPVSLLCPDHLRNDYSVETITQAPGSRLRLEWVYGYKGRDGRSNIHMLPTGEVMYPVAAIVVLFNTEERGQRHYQGHTEDIKCITLHPNKLIVASGDDLGTNIKPNNLKIGIVF